MFTHVMVQYNRHGIIRYNRHCSAPVNLEKEELFASVLKITTIAIFYSSFYLTYVLRNSS